MSLHINKGNNPPRRYNGSEYICTKCWCPQVHKTLPNIKGHIGPHIEGALSLLLSPTDVTSRPPSKFKTPHFRTEQHH
jgi:hypothetical protein